MVLVHHNRLPLVAFEFNYKDDSHVDGQSVASLISALDSFSGIDTTQKDDSKTDALETIQHEGNLIMVEKSANFLIAVTVTNASRETETRQAMASILRDMEAMYADVWDEWDGDPTIFETSIFKVLSLFPIWEVGLDYNVRSKEAGKPLPFKNREVGKAIVEVRTSVAGNTTVGGVVRGLDMPREVVLGCLQILAKYGWIDFHVDVTPRTVFVKRRDVPPDLQKIYGPPVVKFVELCDGSTSMEDVVRKIPEISLAPMKFVAPKLVLRGVLDIVA